MGVSIVLAFKDIYNKAINLFDDPIIQRAYVEDVVRWEKLMYPHLENGIPLFINPTKISYLLADQTLPTGQIDIFEGNGGTIYTTSITPKEGSDFSFLIDGHNDYTATYDPSNNTVVFSKPVPIGSKCSIEWYYPGCFNTDFSSAAAPTISSAIIAYRVKEILSRALVLSWATDEQNFLLDIKNLLTDTDFKLYSPANSVRAKVEWKKTIEYEFDTLTNNLAWELYSRKFHGGNYY